jgi:tetratricopeptide (TPR) repeat protein
LPTDLKPLLVSKAAGSPFFAEELVRGMCEDGTLVCDGGAVRLSRPVRDLPIPGTIQEVIAARLDRLGPGAKRIVQVAAVLGRQFRRSQLEALLEGENIDVGRELEELERRGLLHRKNLLAADEFRFGESLTQEIAYETLLLRQRRQLHERIGRMLESDDVDRPAEHAALLAHHYAHSDDHVKAVDALLRAAREAERLPSYRVAAQYYRQAWQLAESVLGEREDGHFHHAALEGAAALARLTVFFGGDDVCEAQRAAARGAELAEMLGQQAQVAMLQYFGGVLTIMGPEADYKTGLRMGEEALALARRLGLREVVQRIVRGVAMNYTVDGRFAQAEEAVAQTLAEMERDGLTGGDIYLSTLWVRDMCRYASDRWDEVLENGYRTNALALEAGNRTMRTAMATLFAPIHYLRGEYQEAKRWADLGLDLAEQIANVNAYATAASLAMLTRVRLGETFEPGRFVDRIEKGLAAAGTMQLNTRFVGEALLAIGDVDRADRITAALVGRLGGRLRQLLVLLARGDVLVRRGRLGEAAGCFAEARHLAEAIGSRSGLVGALLGAAEVALARGTVPCGVERAVELANELRIVHLQPRLAAVRGAAVELRGA